MNRPRILRLLRIGWSAGCVLVCLLLVALWVRSYWWVDIISGGLTNTRSFQTISCYGKLAVIVAPYGGFWHYECSPSGQCGWRIYQFNKFRYWAVVPRTNARQELALSYKLVLALCMTLTAAPWTSWRFSLRTLFVAMTAVAVLLGAVVYLAKAPATPPVDFGDFGAP